MSEHFLNWLLLQGLEDGLMLATAPFFPGISALGEHPAQLSERLRLELAAWYQDFEPLQWFQHHAPAELGSGSTEISLEAPRHLPLWTQPLTLSFAWVSWQLDEQRSMVHFPSLGTQILVRGSESEHWQSNLQNHLRQQVSWRSAYRLPQLIFWQRFQSLSAQQIELPSAYISPKTRLNLQQGQQVSPLLVNDKGRLLHQESLPPAWELDQPVQTLAALLQGKQAQSVLLVGPAGVGKTALMYQLIRQRHNLGLAQTACWGISGSELIAGNSGFGAWQEQARRLIDEASRYQALLCLGNLMELAEVGKGEHQVSGLAEFLQPAIKQGQIQVLVECTPEQYKLLERQVPLLIQAFQVMQITEPEPQSLRRILRKQAQALTKHQAESWSSEALQTLESLHRRYASYSACPGRMLHFMKRLAQSSPKLIDRQCVLRAFAQESGLPLWLLDPRQELQRERTRSWFEQRIIGQPQATSALLDVLALLKARLNRQERPLASFLLVGPTGVGKTALAKALALFLYGNEKRLLRLDMSEYQQVQAVQRLTGTWGQEGLLTSRIREQPFCVLLLDELEKAHPLFFDLLLQILGEGRLTDHQGRLANFCNTVILMTSNLGARELFQQQPGFTGQAQNQNLEAHFNKAVAQFFRPELFNRLDRVIPFKPLSQEMAEQITRRELGLLHQRQGFQESGLQLECEPEALRYLASQAYDIRYGARPLKRFLERQILLPLAELLNRQERQQFRGAQIQIRYLQNQLQLECRKLPRAATDPLRANLLVCLQDFSQMGKSLQRLQNSQMYRELHNQWYWLNRQKQTYEQQLRQPKTPEALTPFQDWKRWETLQAVRNELHELSESLAEQEMAAWLLYCQDPEAEPLSEALLQKLGSDALRQRLDELMLNLYRQTQPAHSEISLILYTDSSEPACSLLAAYWQLASARYQNVRLSVCQLGQDDQGQRQFKYLALKAPPALADKSQIFVLEITGPDVWLLWQHEAGLHVFREAKGKKQLWGVRVKAGRIQDLETLEHPLDLRQKIYFQAFETRREYRLYAQEYHDPLLGRHPRWKSHWQEALADLMQARLHQVVDALVHDGI